MNDKLEEFHKGHRVAEENLKKANDAKSRTFFFNQNGKQNEQTSEQLLNHYCLLQSAKIRSKKTT